jgi:hypothetical protein
MKDLSIVSNHPIVGKRVFETDDEIWVFNKKGTELPRYDVVFQVHTPEVFIPLHHDWLKENTKYPVYMLEKYPEIPMAVEYPFREVIALTDKVTIGVQTKRPLHFLPFSVCLAIALAIYQERPKIKVWGVELHHKTEYFIQRNGFAFWTGFAAGRGIELEIHGSENIFKNNVYPLSISEYIETKLSDLTV